MSRFRSLRFGVTVVATVVIALPLLGIAAVASVFLRDQAMRFDTAANKITVICLSGSLSADASGAANRRTSGTVSLGEECAVGEHEIAITSKRIGDHSVPGLADTDRVVFYEARYSSAAEIPQLSLWPFTDPLAIDARQLTDTGETSPSRPAAGLSQWWRDDLVAAQATLNGRVLGLVGGALLLTGLFAFVVWFATGRVLRPVEAIRREVADITGHDLSRRVPVPGTRNEIARLAGTVNTTLDRLQAAVEENRRFVADASHELRSPIAALRAELEIAHAHPDLTGWRAVVDGALQDTFRLQHLADDLLTLARLDHAPATASTEPVDLAGLVRAETDRHRSRHAVTTEVADRPVHVRGSRALLARLLGNLLDNAERHAGTRIAVRLAVVDQVALLDVVDDGPGIPPEDRERVFERFTRLDDARTRETGGAGLGLPIARRIARLHRGTLDVSDAPDHDGARFTAVLPLDPA
ncbi:sensor histidine kinase [Saccharothrix texasensis]|uniref:histidine kinase n=1 Tax=Saccharothrix texasensis TaxID=103734 RepID=A0A3N1H3C8_9PSEU|nr:HAMP domain-containing sensor histidine kinase [Saccharothrix texasensis]ROP37005.1 signal transduction histidine kinase [Saccharothrix texasensis]